MSDTLTGPARDLVAGKNFAHLSVPRRDGSIQSAVVWIDVTGDGNLVVNSAEGRGWPANLRRAGRATVSVHDQENPYEFVSIAARLVGDTHEGADETIDALARKYLGVDRYPGHGDGEQRVTFILAPERVTHRN
jgi:PPOX class probable F420-dependent enzyme